jgi:hypothetical protein
MLALPDRYPIELNVSVVAVAGTVMLNIPLLLVAVEVLVPLTVTVTPGNPVPAVSTT